MAATSVEGKATDFALGGALAGAGGGGALGGALGGWSKTPTEKALRMCIQEAVKFIVVEDSPDLLPPQARGVAAAASPRGAGRRGGEVRGRPTPAGAGGARPRRRLGNARRLARS